MNTLHTAETTVSRHPVTAASVTTSTPELSFTRATLLERAAMRVGLWLLLWGRHRSHRRVDRDAYTRHLLAEQVRHDHERAVAYAAFSLPVR